ncbi:MAG: GAF and ANTAR domain-containing protein, partial [Nitriliruptoraceae bacterium]
MSDSNAIDTQTPTSPVESLDRGLVETFVTLADTLVADFDVIEFLSALTVRVVELSIATEAGILLADETGDLQFMAASNERTRLLELFQIQNAEGPCQECFTTGRPVEVPDLELEQERWPRFAPRALDVGFRSVLAVPMRLRGEVLGAMNLFITNPGGMVAPADRTLVQALADIATIGLLQRRTTLNAQLHLGQVQHALHSRIVIEQAKGIIAQQADIPVDHAFDRIR